MKLSIQCFFIVVGLLSTISAETLRWNLKSLYGIDQNGFVSIISDARTHFETSPNDSVIIEIDGGKYEIGGNGTKGISLSAGIEPGPTGRLIFAGAGMDSTTLVFTDTPEDMIYGRKVYRTEFRDMHMTRLGYTVTQGNVVSIAPGEIVLDLHEGFPTPLDLWKDWTQGRYLRRYTKSTTDPQLIRDDNEQIPYGMRDGAYVKPQLISGNRWTFYLNNSSLLPTNYAIGDLVGVKSKHEGNAYWFSEGSDLIFRNIKWTGSSRGLVRTGFSNVSLIGCRIERGAPINGQMPCLSTPSGGPQMNQYSTTGNPVSTDMLVEDFYCDSPGDDCIAFFNVHGGKVLNSTLRNSFARGIMVTQEADDICVVKTTVENSPIEREDKGIIIHDPIVVWSIKDAIAAGIVHAECDSIIVSIVPTGNRSKESPLFLSVVGTELLIRSDENIQEVRITDIRGRLLHTVSGTSREIRIQTEVFSCGTYVIQIVGENSVHKGIFHLK